MKFGNFEQQSKGVVENKIHEDFHGEVVLSQEKINEIKQLIHHQEKTPDLFSEYEADHLDALARVFPLEYAAAQEEKTTLLNSEVEHLDTATIKHNLESVGKKGIATHFDTLPDITSSDRDRYLASLGISKE